MKTSKSLFDGKYEFMRFKGYTWLKIFYHNIYTQGHPFQSDCFEIININNIHIDVSNKHSYDYIFLFVFEEENSMN